MAPSKTRRFVTSMVLVNSGGYCNRADGATFNSYSKAMAAPSGTATLCQQKCETLSACIGIAQAYGGGGRCYIYVSYPDTIPGLITEGYTASMAVTTSGGIHSHYLRPSP